MKSGMNVNIYELLYIFNFQAYDLGMLNGEYIFYSLGVYLSGGSLLDPDYRPEVDVNTLFEGFLTVVNMPVYGEAWEQLRMEIVAAYADPQFASLQPVTDPADVTSFAGESAATMLIQ